MPKPRVVQTDKRQVEDLDGRIEFRNLTFRYTEQEQVFQQFNLTIPAGETVAFVGHTGAGKSSLGKLVARFYEFQDGALLIDGQDIRSFDLASYRRRLGIVPQTPFLFSGTVADNIRYARAGCDRRRSARRGRTHWRGRLAGCAGEWAGDRCR